MSKSRFNLDNCVTTYLIKTIDPVHIGAGGYRLDYIDNVIVENYDTTPKIPGSSLSGVARHYLAREQKNRESGSECGGNNSKCDNGKCIVCQTFGFVKDNQSRKGAVSFSDALLLFFPVATVAGTVWITTIERLLDFNEVIDETVKIGEKNWQDHYIQLNRRFVPANLGAEEYWCVKGEIPFLELDGVLYDRSSQSNTLSVKVPVQFRGTIVAVSEKVFIQTVRRNLEVRTSVAIDPKTGTAEDGALFTYQAIPRDSYLYFQLVTNIPEILLQGNNEGQNMIQKIQDAVEQGMQYYPVVGVGGMTTRGFGRVQCWKTVYVQNLLFSEGKMPNKKPNTTEILTDF